MLDAGYTLRQVRGGETIQEMAFKNAITNEGMDRWLQKIHSGTLTTMASLNRMILIDSTGFTALAPTDNYDNINQAGNGWDEFTGYLNYSNGTTRAIGALPVGKPTSPVWEPDGVLGDAAEFRINTTATLKGVALVLGGSINTPGDHNPSNGTLFSTALFPSDLEVVDEDILFVRYTLSLAA